MSLPVRSGVLSADGCLLRVIVFLVHSYLMRLLKLLVGAGCSGGKGEDPLCEIQIEIWL